MFFMLYNYSLCWKIKRMHRRRSLLLKRISQLLLLAVRLVLWAGLTVRILDFFQMKWNFRSMMGNSNC